jgi:hypothetical protein
MVNICDEFDTNIDIEAEIKNGKIHLKIQDTKIVMESGTSKNVEITVHIDGETEVCVEPLDYRNEGYY